MSGVAGRRPASVSGADVDGRSAAGSADANRSARGDGSTTRPVLEVAGLAAGYKANAVLRKLNLDVAPGDRIAVIGPNGCGKSTLLRAVTGEIGSMAGTVLFNGIALTGRPTDAIIRSGIGYLRQVSNVFGSLTVQENLELAAFGTASPPPGRLRRVLEIFPMLANRLHDRAGLLSGGERQAAALAMTLMKPASLLLLDEPIAGLSPSAAHTILAGLDTLARQEGFAMLLVEHRLLQVQPWVNRVVIMVQGRVEADVTDTTILADPQRLARYYQL